MRIQEVIYYTKKITSKAQDRGDLLDDPTFLTAAIPADIGIYGGV